MKQYLSQKLEMQIPQENVFTGMEIMKDFDKRFEELSKNYNIRKKEALRSYLEENKELISYMEFITPLVNQYFPNNKKYLTNIFINQNLSLWKEIFF